MIRHPHYLEVPWEIRWHDTSGTTHRRLWWLVAILVLAGMFMIGVGVLSGKM